MIEVLAESVMQHKSLFLAAPARHTNNVYNWKELTVGSGDAVQCAEFTHTICCNEHTGQPPPPRISVGGIACIQLIASSNPFQAVNVVYVIE